MIADTHMDIVGWVMKLYCMDCGLLNYVKGKGRSHNLMYKFYKCTCIYAKLCIGSICLMSCGCGYVNLWM